MPTTGFWRQSATRITVLKIQNFFARKFTRISVGRSGLESQKSWRDTVQVDDVNLPVFFDAFFNVHKRTKPVFSPLVTRTRALDKQIFQLALGHGCGLSGNAALFDHS